MTEMTSRSPSERTSEQYVVQYGKDDTEPLSVAIVDTVAAVTDERVTDLEPLHYTINTDALERLFESRAAGDRSGGTVTFEYNDCLVTVSADGEIRVESA